MDFACRAGFVGLVNQAMTCYLNSLIQTLYMTPEFRNALYRWRFDGSDEEQTKSIPFQLQSLFVQLQVDEPLLPSHSFTSIPRRDQNFENFFVGRLTDDGQAFDRDDGPDAQLRLGLFGGVATARHPGAVPRHVRRARAQVQEHAAGGPHLAPLRGQNGRLRPLPRVPHRESPPGYLPRCDRVSRDFVFIDKRMKMCRILRWP